MKYYLENRQTYEFYRADLEDWAHGDNWSECLDSAYAYDSIEDAREDAENLREIAAKEGYECECRIIDEEHNYID